MMQDTEEAARALDARAKRSKDARKERDRLDAQAKQLFEEFDRLEAERLIGEIPQKKQYREST